MLPDPMRKNAPDWRRDNMWLGKGVPFWLVLPAIVGIAWVAVQVFGR